MKRTALLMALAGGLIVALAMFGGATPSYGQDNPTGAPTVTPVQSYAGKVNAPEFPAGLDWINVDQPLTMASLKGKVVLLDFWTYGCINCIHIIPDLKRLEAEFADSLVVIGVHSAKFENEGETENIRFVVQRYQVEHPVVNDRDFQVWQNYAVRAWPTTMLIDPRGKVLGYYSGEGVYDALQPAIAGMVAEFDAQGLIDRTPLKLSPEAEKRAPTDLAFPGKVLADAASKRLFIADTNHHRVIVADLETYTIQAVIGGVEPGFTDGDFVAARFNWVHGLTLNGDTLYVADTGNHALRVVDLAAGTVTTLAGTGQQNQDWGARLKGGPALETALNSPWDIVYHENVIYIAMAGPHQLWTLDLATGQVGPFSGSGREGIVDGAHSTAELAQPSGIVTDGTLLYFADAESSAIRKAELNPMGRVDTIVGTGLFDFGDVDGTGDDVRLQHALGLTIGPDGLLYVADTYNSKIKVIDPSTRESKTFLGGDHGLQDGAEPLFYEPSGISYAEGRLFVADTNNHLIRVIDLASKTTSTLTFPNAELLRASAPTVNADVPGEFFGEVVMVDPAAAAPGRGTLTLDITLPEGYKMNDLAPFTLHVYNDSPILQVSPTDNDLRIVMPEMPVQIPVALIEGNASVTLDAAIFYCEAVNESLCFPANVRFVVPLTVAPDAGGRDIAVRYEVVPPDVPRSTLGGN